MPHPDPTRRPLHSLSLADLRRRTSVKWRAYPTDVLPLWVAEMDCPLAPPVADALRTAVERGDTGYATGAPYVAALRDFAKDRWDWAFDAEQAVIVPDVMMGVVEMLKLVCAVGDQVVVNSPVYAPFYDFVASIDRRVVEVPLGADHRLDLAALENAFRAGAAAYLLCSPHNPTGTVHTLDELTAVADLARRYGVRVVVDEIHAPLVYDGAAHRPFLTVPGAEDALAVLSASKAWNLAGLKAAVAVAGTGAVADLARMPEVVTHGASHLGEIAHVAALADGRDWLDALLADLDENRRLLADLLDVRLPQVRYRMPAGTYLAWLDCRPLGLGDDPAAVFLDRGRVALSSGPTFGTGGAGHARLNLATSPEILTEAVGRLATAVDRAAG